MTNILGALTISNLWNNNKTWDHFWPRYFIRSFTYFEKPSGFLKSVFRKSSFMHMVDNFKVAGKYWRGWRFFNSLYEYEDLEQVYLTYVKTINSWNDGLGWVSSFAWSIIQITCFCLSCIFFSFVWRVHVDTTFT